MRHFTSILILAAATTTARAEPAHLDIETDPMGWVLEGYSLHAGYRPAASPHVRFELGTYGVQFPQAMVDLDASNKGWQVAIVRSAALQVAWFPRDDARGGLFVGGSAAMNVERDSLDGMSVERRTWGVQAAAGYQWFPFSDPHFYLKPWVGLAVVLDEGTPVSIDGRTFDEGRIAPFATVHLGYQQ